MDSRSSNLKNYSQKILILNLVSTGHYANYLQYLIEFIAIKNLNYQLCIIVLNEFISKHQEVVNLASQLPKKNLEFITIKPEEEEILKSTQSKIGRFVRDFQEFRLLCRYAKSLEATQGLMMIADRYLLPLALEGYKLPCPVSGIYYRPSFHYVNFSDDQRSQKERIQHFREKLILTRVMQQPQVKTLFVLDPFVVNNLNQNNNRSTAVYMPDPVKTYNLSDLNLEKIKEYLNLKPDKKSFLLLGSLGERRGIYQLLDAVNLLPDHLCHQFCLVLVGQIIPQDRDAVKSKIAQISQTKPVEIICKFEFVSEQDVHCYFHLADVILSPHQKHIGMSGTLVLAAAAQKPVLSSNYGLMGKLVQDYHLGLTLDSTQPSEIAKGLTRFLQEPESVLCDRTLMKKFAEQNSAEKFADVIFNHI